MNHFAKTHPTKIFQNRSFELWLIAVIIIINCSFVFAQPKVIKNTLVANPDTSKTPIIVDSTKVITPKIFTIVSDTAKTKPDSLKADSLKKKSDLDTTVTYSADRIDLDAKEKISILTGKAIVRYKLMELRAYRIRVDWKRDMVYAEGRPDTLWTDTTATKIDTVVFVDTPLFLDRSSASDSLRGLTMEMNLKTQRGRVFTGASANNQGHYRGEVLKRMEPQVMYVKSGDFTSCDQNPPHFHFHSTAMKMVYKDKLIARPVYLYFGEVPVAALPYGIFSMKPGRHSGLVVPTYGESASRGRYFEHLGYYWAPSDYWDSKVTMSYYEQAGTLWRIDNNYAVRYKLNGSVYGSYSNLDGLSHWDAHWSHAQPIDPTLYVSGNVNYVSDESFRNYYSQSLDERLNQEVQSNLSLSKNWVDSRASLSAGFSGRQNIQTRNYDITYPSLSFRWGTGPIFPKARRDVLEGFGGPPKKSETGESQGIESNANEPSFWETFTYDYNMQLTNSETGVLQQNLYRPDSSLYNHWERVKSQRVLHTSNWNAPFKMLKYFTVNPNLHISHDWVPELTKYSIVSVDSNQNAILDSTKNRGFFTRTTFNTGIGIGTKLYGFFDPKGLLGLTGIRHVLTPGIGLNYTPNFADRQFGYMQRLTNPATGEEIVRDPWVRSGAGATGRNKSVNMSLNLDNIFQARYESGDETKKIDLFTWNLSTSCNLMADSLQWAPINMSWRATPFSGGSGLISSVGVDISSTYSLYKHDYYNETDLYGHEVNQYVWDFPHSLSPFRFTNGSANLSFQWQKPKPSNTPSIPDTTKLQPSSDLPQLPNQQQRYIDPYTGEDTRAFGDSRSMVAALESSWSGSTGLQLSTNRNSPRVITNVATLISSISLSITPTWSISTGVNFDLVTHEVNASKIVTRKDLHCWEINFEWNPRGASQGFMLRINPKSTDLRDLKLEKKLGYSSSSGSLFGW